MKKLVFALAMVFALSNVTLCAQNGNGNSTDSTNIITEDIIMHKPMNPDDYKEVKEVDLYEYILSWWFEITGIKND